MDSTYTTLMRCMKANTAGERCRKDYDHAGGHDFPHVPTGERVTFTTTGATGTVLEHFTRDGLGDLSGEWASVRFDDGETIDVRVDSLTEVVR